MSGFELAYLGLVLAALISFAAVLHHDECAAAKAGKRQPLEQSRAEAEAALVKLGVDCPVISGTIQTDGSIVSWTGDERPSSAVLNFSMPRMFG